MQKMEKAQAFQNILAVVRQNNNLNLDTALIVQQSIMVIAETLQLQISQDGSVSDTSMLEQPSLGIVPEK